MARNFYEDPMRSLKVCAWRIQKSYLLALSVDVLHEIVIHAANHGIFCLLAGVRDAGAPDGACEGSID